MFMKAGDLSWQLPSLPFLSIFLILTACQPDATEQIPDVSDIQVDLRINRFERDLFALDTQNIEAGLQQLKAKYPVFSQVYLGQILGASDPRIAPQGEAAYVRGFLTYPPVRRLYDTTMVVYPDMQPYAEDFRSALRFFKYYFPDEPVPDVTTFISEFSIAAFIYQGNRLGVGLDMFLGRDFPYRSVDPMSPQFSDYLTRTFTPAHLVSKTLQPLADDLVGPPPSDKLIDHMIANGKKLYLLDHLLPYAPDSILLEMSGTQAEWLFGNERNIWAYFLTEDLLYSSKWQDIRKYVDYSPNSPGMPAEAPGRTGNFTGWRIIQAYMNRHPETSLPELLDMRDSQALLDAARYRPR